MAACSPTLAAQHVAADPWRAGSIARWRERPADGRLGAHRGAHRQGHHLAAGVAERLDHARRALPHLCSRQVSAGAVSLTAGRGQPDCLQQGCSGASTSCPVQAAEPTSPASYQPTHAAGSSGRAPAALPCAVPLPPSPPPYPTPPNPHSSPNTHLQVQPHTQPDLQQLPTVAVEQRGHPEGILHGPRYCAR